MIGEEIGSYRIIRQLGEGGMGAVYEAAHTKLGRRAALKMLLPELSRHPQIVERFFNEARAATAISDPGIVQIFDFGYHTTGAAYIVMELLEGEPLDRRLSRMARMPVADAVRICRQVATSLGRAHAKGIVHRDLKPENIYLTPDVEMPGGERAKILDFGIAKLIGDELARSKTRTGAFMGTPDFASPEQCRGAGELDHRSDVYALGCILFRLVVGRNVFLGEGVGDLISAHMREPPPVPSLLAPDLPPEIDGVILCCLAKDPAGRYQTMGAMAAALGAITIQLGGSVGSTPAFGVPAVVSGVGLAQPHSHSTLGGAAAQSVAATAPPRSRSGWVIAVAAVLVIGGSVAVVLATRKGEEPAQAAAPSPDATVAAVATPDAAAAPAVVVADAAPAAEIALPAGATAPKASAQNRKPAYPKGGRKDASVTLRLVVELDGSVRSPTLIAGAPPFSDAAIAAVAGWKFTPASLRGQPIAVFHQVTLSFNAPSRGKKAGSGSDEVCPPELCTR